MKRLRSYRRRRHRSLHRTAVRFPAVFAVLCTAGFLVLFGWIWYSFGPFEQLRASGWPAAHASASPPAKQAPAAPSATAPPPEPSASPQPSSTAQRPLSYVQVKDVSGESFTGKLMVVSDPSKITAAAAPGLGDVGAPLGRIIAAAGAAGGVNGGDFKGYDGTGGQPAGIVVSDGKTVYLEPGQEEVRVTGLNAGNKLLANVKTAADELDKLQLRCAVSAGPALVRDGVALSVDGGDAGPQTAIGQREDGAILLLVIDGRSEASAGASLLDVAGLLVSEGAVTAAALDGGSSATMAYLGKTLSNPCNVTGERSIASAILVMPGGYGDAD